MAWPRIPYGAYRPITYGSEFQGGFDLGNTLMQGIAKIRQQQQMDAIANQLLNQATPPRAALVDPRGGALKFIPGVNAPVGTDPNAPVPTTGTAPATGGLAELQLRQQFAQQDLADQLKRAQVAEALAKATGTGAYAKRTGPTPGQQAVQQRFAQRAQAQKEKGVTTKIAADIKAGTDTAEQLTKDFDSVYGKGQAQTFFDAYRTNSGTRGNVVNGRFVPDEAGDYYTTAPVTQAPEGGVFGVGAQQMWPKMQAGKLVVGTGENAVTHNVIKMSEVQPYLDRLSRITAGGGKYVPRIERAQPVNVQPFSSESGAAATADTDTASSTAAPPAPSTQDEYDALPSGSQFVDGDGQLKVKS